MNRANEIKRAVSMRRVVAQYGFIVNRSGFIRCPFHIGDHTASLKVYDGPNGWHCFGCGRGGSVIDFVMEYECVGFTDACRRLDILFSLGLFEPVSFKQRRTEQKARAERERNQRDTFVEEGFSSVQYAKLCRYRRWLAKQPDTLQVQFDLAYIDRLLEMFLSPDVLILFDADARINALLSKHKNRGDYDTNSEQY